MKFIITLIFIPFALLTLINCHTSKPAFDKSQVKEAQKVIGLSFTDQKIDTLHPYLLRNLEGYQQMREYDLDYGVLPAIRFDPIPVDFTWPTKRSCVYVPEQTTKVPTTADSIALLTIAELSSLLKSQKLSATTLTEIYLQRIKKYDPTLHAVITLMEEDALAKAAQADKEIAAGNYKGPLHGIPYGVKDLIAIEGYPTTWGTVPYKNQVLNETATIVRKLDEAGAICLAKLSSGALARGDVWWGGQTMNPWDTLQGASGSSAGSGSATAAGLVGFAIGTETLGSITSPSTRNGITGLRPSYGRVSRKGVMPLSWSMDKVGPMCRSAEDCVLVFQVIQGNDPLDPTLYDINFCYDKDESIDDFKIGFLEQLFVKDTSERGDLVAFGLEDIRKILPMDLIVDSLPSDYPFKAFDVILRAEAATVFDDMVRSQAVDSMVQQSQRSRANSLRQARFIPAVEYIQANRYRDQLIQETNEVMQKYDVVITPTFGQNQLVITNLTGHPVITMPVGIDEEGHPISISLLGNLFEEDKILKVAKYIQDRTVYHTSYPPLVMDQSRN